MTRPNALFEARDRFTKLFIIRNLEKHDWNVTHTAEAMGIERAYLYQLMQKYEIRRP